MVIDSVDSVSDRPILNVSKLSGLLASYQ